MAKFTMLVGVPGSGKSYMCKKLEEEGVKVFSSDSYREKLLGNENDQSNNDLVFSTMHKDILQSLQNGEDCAYDATNIDRKTRKLFLDKIKNKGIKCEKIALVMTTPVEQCYENNKNRERVVPDFVIDKFVSKFEIPVEGEGFDEIHLVYSWSDVSIEDALKSMEGVDQNNPHHTLTLSEHCEKASEYPGLSNEMKAAAKLHDYGKLFTRTIDDKGVAHFYNHENVGAYRLMSILLNCNLPNYFVRKIITAVNYHMIPYIFDNMGDKKKELTKSTLLAKNAYWYDICKLHEADEWAH